MPVLKVYKNGEWEELGGTSPMNGGNADTLEWKPASYFASVDTVAAQINNAIDNLYDYGTTDLTAGSSQLSTGKLYFVYE